MESCGKSHGALSQWFCGDQHLVPGPNCQCLCRAFQTVELFEKFFFKIHFTYFIFSLLGNIVNGELLLQRYVLIGLVNAVP